MVAKKFDFLEYNLKLSEQCIIMPTVRKDAPYDPKSKDSLLEYASKLKGKYLKDVCDGRYFEQNYGKGEVGSIIEDGYFFIEKNNDPSPDFDILGIELKVTPLKRNSKAIVPKERISLEMINYLTLLEEGFEKSFYRKNRELLIIFYLDEGEEFVGDKKIMGSKLWTYPPEDLRIIREDWNIIADKVRNGLAHEISCGDTRYIEASPKGAGHGKGMRAQPYSDIKAKPRAFALKNRYVSFIWNAAKDTENAIKTLDDWSEDKTFEEIIIDNFKPYYGKDVNTLFKEFDLEGSKNKGVLATLARRMMGVSGKKITEFEKADIVMKTVRLLPSGYPKESMSFPSFDYVKLSKEEWETSDFHEKIEKRFFFVVFQMNKDDSMHLSKVGFWNMPYEDLCEVQRVWEDTQLKIRNGVYDEFLAMSETRVSHVRPHGRDNTDTILGPDGKEHTKKSFWLNRIYVGDIIKKL